MPRTLEQHSAPTQLIPSLAAEIRREHEAATHAFASAVEHAARCGKLLAEVKAQLAHGEWLPWLAENFPASVRTAQNYMRLATHPDAQGLAHMGIEGALRHLAEPEPELVLEYETGLETEVEHKRELVLVPDPEHDLTRRQQDMANAARDRVESALHHLDGMCMALADIDPRRATTTATEEQVTRWLATEEQARKHLQRFAKLIRQASS